MIENYWKIIDEIVNDKYLSKKLKLFLPQIHSVKAINITYGLQKK